MRPVLTIGKKLEKFFILFLLIFSSGLFAKDVLVEENNNIYYKKGREKFYLFNGINYCYNKNGFWLEKINNSESKYLVVNYTEDCNPSGQYRIFEISSKEVKEFYLSPLYDPEFKKNRIIERFKDGAISYKRIYLLESGKYILKEEWRTLAPNLNLTTFFSNPNNIYVLKSDLGKIVEKVEVSSRKAFLFDQYFNKKRSYLINGDIVRIKNIVKNKDEFYLNIEYLSKGGKVVKGYILISDIL
ncbi:hypothetical protein [Acinetobacter indicus]|uniref:hypothetical protein n=1 Tax=Acinetobacter indicus TaxID=756892 RepID=UPI001443A129|nr:hypothetical protein [Acinetobacter indicus]